MLTNLNNQQSVNDTFKAPRCGARTRRGQPCQAPAIKGKKRCRMHGGRSTGPRTPEGLERSRRARWKHGRYSKAAIEARRTAHWETPEEGKARLEREARRAERQMARRVHRLSQALDLVFTSSPIESYSNTYACESRLIAMPTTTPRGRGRRGGATTCCETASADKNIWVPLVESDPVHGEHEQADEVTRRGCIGAHACAGAPGHSRYSPTGDQDRRPPFSRPLRTSVPGQSDGGRLEKLAPTARRHTPPTSPTTRSAGG